jgi:hypothetical protein
MALLLGERSEGTELVQYLHAVDLTETRRSTIDKTRPTAIY